MTEFDLHWAEVRRKHIERRRVIVFSMGFIFWIGLIGGAVSRMFGLEVY